MIRMRVALVAVICMTSTSLAVAQTAPSLPPHDVAAILRVDSSYVRAVLRQRWDSLVALFAPNVTLMAPNELPAKGRSENLARLQRFQIASVDYSHAPRVVDGAGGMAYLEGDYRIQMSMAGMAQPFADQGKYLWILRKQPTGGWLIERLIWNSNPAQPAG